MKQLLLLTGFLFSFQIAFTQTFDVQAIKTSGADDKRINLVILSEGYQSSEFGQFEADAISFMNDMFSQSPYLEYENYFNVYIIKVPSNQSGASHPATAPDEPLPPDDVPVLTVDNYFGTAYDSFNIHRLLYTSNTALISTVLANNFPMYDQALLLVNAPYYGGSGGQFPISSTGVDAGEIAIHEIGHSFVDLNDEYYPGDALAAESINMTQDNNPSTVKWKNWLGINAIGTYRYGTIGTPAGTWFRPHETCKMRYLGFPFCSVCTEGTIEEIHSRISPIDSYTPTSATINGPTFPLEFQLNQILPIPNTLETTWTLNSTSFATNIDTVTLQENDVNAGNNTLTAVVHDVTTLLDVDGHNSGSHVYTVTWTIDNTLGIQDVEANNFSISMYPNPSTTFVNFKMENTLEKDVIVEIISVDGKKIKSINLSNAERSQIDISALSPGIYITNFYADTALIASKKLIKN